MQLVIPGIELEPLTTTSGKSTFFAALVQSLNILSPHEIGFWDEKELRSECYSHYIRSRSQVDKLNQTLCDANPEAFDYTRTGNYAAIKNDKETIRNLPDQRQKPKIIPGLICVEGVILCKKLGLDAIYEIDIVENNIQYSMATPEGYHLNVSAEEMQKQIGVNPVLINYSNSYYIVTKSPGHEPAKTRTIESSESSSLSSPRPNGGSY